MSSESERAESRRRWGAAAAGWTASADEHARLSMPVSAWLVDAIAPQPGHTVLELAAGLGDTGFLAAELIQPGGTLICSDFAPEMLSAAQERARRLGIANARFRQIDPETAIDLGTASVDGAICRWGYMLMHDPATALRETRRVLKPGARLALATWAAPDRNPWTRLAGAALARRGLVAAPEPGAPGMFAWASPALIAGQLDAAGFTEHHVEQLAFEHRHASFEPYWRVLTAMGSALREALDSADPATREAVREEVREGTVRYAAADGSLALPACANVAVALA